MRLAIAVPCHVFVAPQMAQSLVAMCWDLAVHRIEGGVRFLPNAVSTYGRNELVRWAKTSGADKVLWIDTDMVFPHDSARRLIDSGLSFVGANYAMKEGERRSSAAANGERVQPKPSGFDRVDMMGFGLTLTDMKVLDAVGDPWFKVLDGCLEGPADEVRFCDLAIQAGYPPYVDHALSAQVGHIGLHDYRLSVEEESLAYR